MAARIRMPFTNTVKEKDKKTLAKIQAMPRNKRPAGLREEDVSPAACGTKEKISMARVIIINLTPLQEGAIRMRRLGLTYPAPGDHTKEIPLKSSTQRTVGVRIQSRESQSACR